MCLKVYNIMQNKQTTLEIMPTFKQHLSKTVSIKLDIIITNIAGHLHLILCCLCLCLLLLISFNLH